MAISYVGPAGTAATATGVTTITVPMPTGHQSGDLIILTLHESAATVTHPATPTGWSSWQAGAVVGTAGTNQIGLIQFYKFATSSSEASVAFTGLPSGRYAAHTQAWRGVDSATPKDVANTTASSTTANPTPAAITPVTSGAVVIATNTDSAATGVTNTTWSSTNGTVIGSISSTSTGTVNATGATSYASWTSGAFSPNLTASGTIARGLSVTSALRPSSAVAASGTASLSLSASGTASLPRSGTAALSLSGSALTGYQSFTDDLNRSSWGSNWEVTNPTATAASWTLDGSQVVAGTSLSASRWTTPVYGNQYSQVVYVGTGIGCGPAVAMPEFINSTVAAAAAFYLFRQKSAGGTAISVKGGSGSATFTDLATDATNLVAGDVLLLEYDGTTLTGYVNGVQRIQTSPASPISGQPHVGLAHNNTTQTGVALLDNWAGGSTALAAVAAQAAGTASVALSGSGNAAAATAGTGSLALSASGSLPSTASGSASLSLTGAGTSQTPVSGSATLVLTGSGSPQAPDSGTGALALSASAAASAIASGAASLTLNASGVTQTPASGAAVLTLSASGASQAPEAGSAALTLNASSAVSGAASGAASLALNATGTALNLTTGTAVVTLSGSGGARATAAGSAPLSMSGSGGAQSPSSGTGTLTVSASGAAQATASGTASLTLSGADTARQSFTDDLNRTSWGANWEVTAPTSGLAAWTLDGSQVVGGTSLSASRWTTAINGTQYSQAAFLGSGKGCGPAVAMPGYTNSTLNAAAAFYLFRPLSAGGTAISVKGGSGSSAFTDLATHATNLVAGDVLLLTYDGVTLTGYVNGVQRIQVSPASPLSLTAQPYVGLAHNNTTQTGVALLDNWAGGNATVSAPASGTASLSLSASGTVTVRPTGTASLSLSASGAATAQSSGSATVTLSASGGASAVGAGAASLSLGAAGLVQAPVSGQGSLILTAAADAAVLMVGSASLDVTAIAAAQNQAIGHAVLSLTGTATGRTHVSGAASVRLLAAGSGHGVATARVSLTLSATGSASARATGSASVHLSTRAVASATGTGSARLTLSGLGHGFRVPSGGHAALALTGAATLVSRARSEALLSLHALAQVQARASGSAFVRLVGSGTAVDVFTGPRVVYYDGHRVVEMHLVYYDGHVVRPALLASFT